MDKIFEYRKENLRKPTKAEIRFNRVIQLCKGGHKYKIKKQAVFVDSVSHKGYIADFYIHDLSLVFEIDGSHHAYDPQKSYDLKRDSFFGKRGIKVIRIANFETNLRNKTDLVTKIERIIKNRKNVIQRRGLKPIKISSPQSVSEEKKAIEQFIKTHGKKVLKPSGKGFFQTMTIRYKKRKSF